MLTHNMLSSAETKPCLILCFDSKLAQIDFPDTCSYSGGGRGSESPREEVTACSRASVRVGATVVRVAVDEVGIEK